MSIELHIIPKWGETFEWDVFDYGYCRVERHYGFFSVTWDEYVSCDCSCHMHSWQYKGDICCVCRGPIRFALMDRIDIIRVNLRDWVDSLRQCKCGRCHKCCPSDNSNI